MPHFTSACTSADDRAVRVAETRSFWARVGCGFGLALVTLYLGACASSSEPAQPPLMSPDRGATPTISDAIPPDEDGDARPQPQPDDGAVRPPPDDGGVRPQPRDGGNPTPGIANCQDACNRHIACDRLDVFGDRDACLSACERVGRVTSLATWFECLDEEMCAQLHACVLPEPPSLACQGMCDAAAACGVFLPFPNCVTECDDSDRPDAFGACGEPLVSDQCDAGAFWRCLIRDVFVDCGALCALGERCELVDPAECAESCIVSIYVGDALMRLRATQRTACARGANMDCAGAERCFDTEGWEPIEDDEEAFCVEWDRCFAARIPCADILPAARLNPGTMACMIRALRRGCPEGHEELLFACQQGATPPGGPGCAELCEARTVCGRLPPRQDEAACVAGCNQILSGAAGNQQALQRAMLPCGEAADCIELAMCIEDAAP